MSGAFTTAGRVTKRELCRKHGIEFGQVYIPGIPGQTSSYWEPAMCRECEADLRREQLATEQLQDETAAIVAEAEKRIEADPNHDKVIQGLAEAALGEEIAGIVAHHCAMRRPEWEKYFSDARWNEVVATIEAEKRAEFLAAEKRQANGVNTIQGALPH